MNSIRPVFGLRRLRFSRIVYRCDVSSAAGAIIPLGIMSDVIVGDVYGLGLIARKNLSEAEANMVGGLVRAKICAPFATLEREFDRIWNKEDRGEEFTRLPSATFSALDFGALTEGSLSVPPSLLAHSNEVEAIKLWVTDKLEATLRDQYWSLMGDHLGGIDQRAERLEAA